MPSAPQTGLIIRLLGPMQVERDGLALAVPASRKARAILGYLALSPRPVSRQRLCDLFFDAPDDPRASLRWVLTKLRALVDEPGVSRIVSVRDALSFDPAGAQVDALALLRGAEDAAPELAGAFLEDAELPDRQEFMLWLYAARDQLRAAGMARLREQMAAPDLAAEQRLSLARQLLALDPLDGEGSIAVVRSLAELGRVETAREAAADAERSMRRAGRTPPAELRAALRTFSQAPAPLQPAQPSAPPAAPRGLELFDMQPCVAAVPFHNYSPDVITEELMDGFIESVIHMFSRFRMFRVLGLSDALALKGSLQSPADMHERAGADFIVGGSVMARGAHAKVRYRIIDARNGALLSSGDIEGPAVSPASMFEDLPVELVPHLMHQCMELSRNRAAATPEAERTPVQHYLAGLGHAYFSTAPDFPRALACFEAALAARPDYAPAMACAAHSKATLQLTREEPARSQALAQAHAAIALSNDDAFALSLAAWSLVHIGQEAEPAQRAADLAVRVNPLARIAWSVNGWIRAMSGDYETAMAHWDRADRCNPLGASGDLVHSGRALCCWMAGRYAESLAWARRSLERVPNNPGALTAGVAAALLLNDRDALSVMAARMRQHYPQGADSPVIAGVPILVAERRAAILAATRQGLAEAAAG